MFVCVRVCAFLLCVLYVCISIYVYVYMCVKIYVSLCVCVYKYWHMYANGYSCVYVSVQINQERVRFRQQKLQEKLEDMQVRISFSFLHGGSVHSIE